MDGRTNGTNGRTNCPSVGHFKQYSRSSETNITLSSVKFKFYVIVGKIDAENAETKRRMPSTGRVRKCRLWQVNWWSVIFILLNFLILFFISQLFFCYILKYVFLNWRVHWTTEKIVIVQFWCTLSIPSLFSSLQLTTETLKIFVFLFCSLGSS